MDGKASEWTKDMIVAQGVANDDPRIFRGSHEGPVYDLYSLSAAWDDANLYLMWQFTNVTDVTDPAQGYPTSDNGKPYQGDIPQSLALDVDPDRGGEGLLGGRPGEPLGSAHLVRPRGGRPHRQLLQQARSGPARPLRPEHSQAPSTTNRPTYRSSDPQALRTSTPTA